MGLAEVQRLMARVYTDQAAREQFFRDSDALAREYGLAPEERRQIEQVSACQLRFAAEALRHKRLNSVAKLLPVSRQALGQHFEQLFLRHADAFAPSGIRRHREDALAFAAFVERLAPDEPIEPSWSVDQLRYEAAWLRAADANPCCIVRYFRHPIDARDVGDAGSSTTLSRPAVALWLRVRLGGRLRHVVCML